MELTLTPESMSQSILNFIRANGGALAFELVNHIGEEAEGDYIMSIDGHENILIWAGISQLFIEAMGLLQADLEVHRASPKMYAFFNDGIFNMPIVSIEEYNEGTYPFSEQKFLPLVFFIKGNQPKDEQDHYVDSLLNPITAAQSKEQGEAGTIPAENMNEPLKPNPNE